MDLAVISWTLSCRDCLHGHNPMQSPACPSKLPVWQLLLLQVFGQKVWPPDREDLCMLRSPALPLCCCAGCGLGVWKGWMAPQLSARAQHNLRAVIPLSSSLCPSIVFLCFLHCRPHPEPLVSLPHSCTKNTWQISSGSDPYPSNPRPH